TNSLAKCGDSGGLKWAVGPFDDIICVRRSYRLQNCAVELLEGFMAARPIEPPKRSPESDFPDLETAAPVSEQKSAPIQTFFFTFSITSICRGTGTRDDDDARLTLRGPPVSDNKVRLDAVRIC